MISTRFNEKIKNNQLFHGIEHSDLIDLTDDMFKSMSMKKGDVLKSEALESIELILVVRGRISIYCSISDSEFSEFKTKELQIDKLSNTFAGELGYFNREIVIDKITCISDSELILIDYDNLAVISDIVPQISENIFEAVSDMIFNNSHCEISNSIKNSLLKELYSEVRKQRNKLKQLNNQLKKKNAVLSQKNEELFMLATHDYLTKIYNRRFVLDMFLKEFSKTQRYGINLSCMLLDIDNFSFINDSYGHLIGDQILQQVSLIIQQNIRRMDIFGRYSSKEFLIVLPNTSLLNAQIVADKINSRIEDSIIATDRGIIQLTVSIGLTDSCIGLPDSVDEMIKNADYALKDAKKHGKSQIGNYENLIKMNKSFGESIFTADPKHI
eukprot:Anaeramoba_ignava/a2513_26.p1 GENE.a2513_26~~a2513_26.p1  ORF type:complete len:384 (-),score=42.87 a2513_26:98-1249(-)